jgi:hypothetical protein
MVLTAPAVIVHGLPDARAACAPGRPLVLLSAPGAAGYAGCLWWIALAAAARAQAPGLIGADILDCGAAAGYALDALRSGQRVLVLAPSCPARAAVVSAATGIGATVLDRAPPALDMAAPDAPRRLAAWLART